MAVIASAGQDLKKPTRAGKRSVWIGLVCVLVGGAVLRFWNLTAGLPYRIGVDEPVIAERAIHIMRTGDFNPHFFDYPALYIYVQVAVGCVQFLIGALNGSWQSLEQFSPDHLLPWMRTLNAALGTMTLLVIYRAGLRWGPWVGLLAAGMMAVWPNHVRESHFALTDVPLTLLTTLVLLLSLRAYETGKLGWFLGAGASVGLAAATKYGGGAALVIPIIAAASAGGPRSSRVWRAVAASGAAAGAFIVGAPFTLLDLPAFLNGFGFLASSYLPRPFGSGAEVYLGHLRVASGWSGVVLAGSGVVWGTVRGIRDRDIGKWALIVVFPVASFYMIATKQLIFGRYLLPVLPFLCLLMAIVIVDVLGWISRLGQPQWVRAAIGGAFASAVLLHLAIEGIAWPIEYGRPTTQDVAYGMIRQFIPERSRVAIERSVLHLPATTYRTIELRQLTERSPQEYRSSGVTFLVASSDAFGPVFARPAEHADAHQAYQRLFNDAGRCLPAVEPTARMSGPRILICRLLTQ